MVDNVRKTALRILNDLESGKKTLDVLMDETHEATAFSAKRDRALLQTLVYGVLRWRLRLDGIIAGFSKTGLKKIRPKVLNVLRLGLYQLVFLDRIPASAAVNTSVEMAKSVAAPWVTGFVNAILRKAAAGPLPRATGLSEEKSMPEWLLSRWIHRFGKSAALELCDAVNRIPPLTIRTNTLRTTREALVERIAGQAGDIYPTECSPEGICLVSPQSAVHEMSVFKKGEFQVQDEAAQLAGHILSPRPGESVLDACAGLGGKTGHAAQLMENKGELCAMDKDAGKLSRLETDMRRMGVSIVNICPQDLMHPLKFPKTSTFNRILLDAPCSGLGVLRRNPDAKWTVSETEFERLQATQLALLRRLSPLLKPSGILVYVVCSTEPEENEFVIRDFLNEHSNFRPDPITSTEHIPTDCITEEGFFKTYPHRLSMDGFFAARLKRRS